MVRATIFSLFLLVYTVAYATTRDICGIEIPPARFERSVKLPISGPFEYPAHVVAKMCVGSGERNAVGCTTMIGLRDAKGFHPTAAGIVIAIRPNTGVNPACTRKKWRESILRHELAHVAGWPQNHGD